MQNTVLNLISVTTALLTMILSQNNRFGLQTLYNLSPPYQPYSYKEALALPYGSIDTMAFSTHLPCLQSSVPSLLHLQYFSPCISSTPIINSFCSDPNWHQNSPHFGTELTTIMSCHLSFLQLYQWFPLLHFAFLAPFVPLLPYFYSRRLYNMTFSAGVTSILLFGQVMWSDVGIT